ncbi:MAG: gamma carbonic anhydrase family protein [Dehalococcoidia bacterium]|nr:gamma carbonic anhydrase family protein [Dehalococcoidia bacterium]
MLRELDGKKPQLHPTAWVSEAAYVIGDIELGEDSSIWPGAVVRGDTGHIKIGKGTNIQDNCTIHSDADAEYGDYVTLGHGVVCHAKKLGNYVLLGNGAIINDGVEVGEYSIIAAGAVVLENTKIPPHSMVVGIPGQVRAQTQERHHNLIRRTSQSYIEKSKRYRRQGNLGS